MKNMNTTLEIPEGSKATIQGKVIDGKNYLVVEMENEEQAPEWTKFKRGDVLVDRECWGNKFVLFDEYVGGSNRSCFNCIYNNMDKSYSDLSKRFCKATDKEKAEYFEWLRDEEGLEWDGEKLVEVLKEGDMCIFWDDEPREAIIAIYHHSVDGNYVDHMDFYWDNALKWDGTKEQYEKVLRGELK